MRYLCRKPQTILTSSNHFFQFRLPSSKLTPWQSSGLKDEFPLKIGDFQGPTVNLPEGKRYYSFGGDPKVDFRNADCEVRDVSHLSAVFLGARSGSS